MAASALQRVEVEQRDALVDGKVLELLEAHHDSVGVGLSKLGQEVVLEVDVGGLGVRCALQGLETKVGAEGGQEGAVSGRCQRQGEGPTAATAQQGVREETSTPARVQTMTTSGGGRRSGEGKSGTAVGRQIASEFPSLPGLPQQGEVLLDLIVESRRGQVCWLLVVRVQRVVSVCVFSGVNVTEYEAGACASELTTHMISQLAGVEHGFRQTSFVALRLRPRAIAS